MGTIKIPKSKRHLVKQVDKVAAYQKPNKSKRLAVDQAVYDKTERELDAGDPLQDLME